MSSHKYIKFRFLTQARILLTLVPEVLHQKNSCTVNSEQQRGHCYSFETFERKAPKERSLQFNNSANQSLCEKHTAKRAILPQKLKPSRETRNNLKNQLGVKMENIVYPKLLPKNNSITNPVIISFREKLMHAGVSSKTKWSLAFKGKERKLTKRKLEVGENRRTWYKQRWG